jgi:hypothetical protein
MYVGNVYSTENTWQLNLIVNNDFTYWHVYRYNCLFLRTYTIVIQTINSSCSSVIICYQTFLPRRKALNLSKNSDVVISFDKNYALTWFYDLGSMLWSQFSAIFANFRRKKLAFFSKTNVMIKILHNLPMFWVKNANFCNFFGENILKIVTSYPEMGYMMALNSGLFPWNWISVPQKMKKIIYVLKKSRNQGT